MYTGHVQGVVAPTNTQKTRALLKRLGPQTSHLEQLLPALEGAVGLAPAHHRFGHRVRQTRHTREQRHTGGIQIHAHRVHAVFDHGFERAGEFALVHIVLILAYANRFGVDLNELSQRVLQAARNAGRAAQAHIHIGHFLRCKFAGAVDRSTGLTYHHFGDGVFGVQLGQLLDQVASQFVGFTAGSAVANGNQVHTILLAQLGQGEEGAIPVTTGLMRIHRGGIDQFASGIDHRHFHTSAYAWVKAHHRLGASGGGQQQVAQVIGKHFNGHRLGVVAQAGKQVALGAQAELDAPSPGHTFAQQVVGFAASVAPAQVQGDTAFGHTGLAGLRHFGQDQLGIQNLQRAATKHGQRPVAGHTANGFVVIKVVAKLGHIGVVFVFARQQLALQQAVRPQPLAQALQQ